MAYNEKGYSYQPAAPKSQREAHHQTQVRAGADFGRRVSLETTPLHSTVRENASSDKYSKTYAALSKFMSNEARRMSKEAQEKQYMLGVQRAMLGASTEEIRENQPFWHKWTGDSDVLKGAAAYNGRAAALRAQNYINENIDHLSDMNDEERTQYLISVYDEMSPKDELASLLYSSDIMGMQSSMNNLLANRIQRNNVDTFQREMNLTLKNGGDWFRGIHDAYTKGDVTPQAYEEAMLTYGTLFELPTNIDKHTGYKTQVDALAQLAEEGNFTAYQAYKATNLYQTLPPDYQDNLDKRVEQAAKGVGRDLANRQYMGDMIDLQNRMATGDLSTAEAVAEMERINNLAKFEMALPTELYTSNNMLGANAPTEAAIRSATASKNSAEMKKQQQLLDMEQYGNAMDFGIGYHEVEATGGKKLWDSKVSAKISNGDPREQVGFFKKTEKGDQFELEYDMYAMDLLSINFNKQQYVHPQTKRVFDSLGNIMNNNTYSTNLDTVILPNFRAMVDSGNIAMAHAYLGDDGFSFMMNYSNNLIQNSMAIDGGDSNEMIFNQSLNGYKNVSTLDKKTRKNLKEDVLKKVSPYTETGMLFWKDNNLPDKINPYLDGLADNLINQLPHGLAGDPDMAADWLSTKMDQSMWNNEDFVIFNIDYDGNRIGTERIDNMIKAASGESILSNKDISTAINQTIINRLGGIYGKEKGWFSDKEKLKNVEIVFANTQRDVDGVPYLMVHYMDRSDSKTNSILPLRIGMDELGAEAKKIYNESIKTKPKTKPDYTAFGQNFMR